MEQARPDIELYEEMMAGVSIPKFAPVEYEVKVEHSEAIEGIEKAIVEEIARTGVLKGVKPGSSIAITAGSREIDRIVQILRCVADEIKKAGGEPFIVPSMGSHGGADPVGQVKLLENFGITEEAIGVPVISSLETVSVGATEGGLDVRIDRCAAEADGIVVVGRVKPHTNFRGKVESGLMKMMAIGLGNPYGAALCHQLGMENMEKNVWDFGNVIIQNASIVFGLAIVENNEHRACLIEAVPAEYIPVREPELLVMAKSLMSRIPFNDIDLLIVEETGKEFSGTGMDMNVTGRNSKLGDSQPAPKRIAALDLTDHSEGNAAGIHEADVITERFEGKIKRRAVYVNAITVREIEGLRTPAVMPNDRLALKLCIMTLLPEKETKKIRAVWIKNTLNLGRFMVSEGLLEEAARNNETCIVGEPEEILFDGQGNILKKID